MKYEDIEWGKLNNRIKKEYGRQHKFVVSKLVRLETGAFYSKDYELSSLSLLYAFQGLLEDLEKREEARTKTHKKWLASVRIKSQPFFGRSRQFKG